MISGSTLQMSAQIMRLAIFMLAFRDIFSTCFCSSAHCSGVDLRRAQERWTAKGLFWITFTASGSTRSAWCRSSSTSVRAAASFQQARVTVRTSLSPDSRYAYQRHRPFGPAPGYRCAFQPAAPLFCLRELLTRRHDVPPGDRNRKLNSVTLYS